MTIAWLTLLVAGVLEIVWAHTIRLTEGFTRPIPSIVFGVLTVAIVLTLNKAMDTLPVGTAYAVFVGIGAVGTAAVGMIWLHEPVTFARGLALALIVGGVILLRLTESAAAA